MANAEEPAPPLERRSTSHSFAQTEAVEMSPRPRIAPIQRDKLLFLGGIMNVVLHSSFTTSPPLQSLLLYLYTLLFVLLLSWRFYTYRRDKYHLFMLDWCYWTNALLVLYIWVLPKHPDLFSLVHACASGPLLIAAVVWRNSVVFHDVDKMTSCFLHLSPACVVYVLRHGEGHASDFWYTEHVPCDPQVLACAHIDEGWGGALWLRTFVFPLAYWVAWCLLYALLINLAPCTAHWREDRGYQTSYRWIASQPGADLYPLVTIFGDTPWLKAVMFGLINFLYTVITLLPGVVAYKIEAANAILLGAAGLVTVWNGAGFYFHVFSKRYAKQIADEENAASAVGSTTMQVLQVEPAPLNEPTREE
eukprot:TRINITY_DN32569_c0_g1_i1.p1 TRINITY_DN32569_c0_g1~~TRINITY_DN32569_c0_g1_i1.p1  ORF type:complete len:375 (+),score=121.19 TRINITY_DN32569_c0_g1_i1:41-1126(+)